MAEFTNGLRRVRYATIVADRRGRVVPRTEFNR